MADKRFPQLRLEDLDAEQKPLGEAIMKVSSIGLQGPYNPLLRSPVLGQVIYDLLKYLRWNSSLPMRLTEFAILIVGRQWRSQIEWVAHVPIALKEGLAQQVIDDLRQNKRPAKMQDDEALVYDFVSELYTKHKVSDETFVRARKLFSDKQIVDLTVIGGTYVTVAALLAMAEEPVPAGKEPAFKPTDP
jgi:4-carboxymuconolactone decarboxylase